MNKNLNSHSGFKYGIIVLILILTFIFLLQILDTGSSETSTLIMGLLIMGIGIASILGAIKSLKGINDPNTPKKIIGILINFGTALLFVSVIVANIFDIYRALG